MTAAILPANQEDVLLNWHPGDSRPKDQIHVLLKSRADRRPSDQFQSIAEFAPCRICPDVFLKAALVMREGRYIPTHVPPNLFGRIPKRVNRSRFNFKLANIVTRSQRGKGDLCSAQAPEFPTHGPRTAVFTVGPSSGHADRA